MGAPLKAVPTRDDAKVRRSGAVDFLRRALDNGATDVELRDLAEAATVGTWPLDLDADTICDVAFEAAEGDADGRAGKIRYALVAKEKGEPKGRFAFVVDTGAPSYDGMMDVNLSRGAEIAEALRDRRELMRLVFLREETTAARSERTEAALLMRLESHEKIFLDLITVVKDFQDSTAERQFQVEKLRTHANTVQRGIDEMVPLVGAVANRLLARAGAPSAALDPALVFFLKSFTDEQRQGLSGILSPPQQAALFEIQGAIGEGKAPLGMEMIDAFLRSLEEAQLPKLQQIMRPDQWEFFLTMLGRVAEKAEARKAEAERAKKGAT